MSQTARRAAERIANSVPPGYFPDTIALWAAIIDEEIARDFSVHDRLMATEAPVSRALAALNALSPQEQGKQVVCAECEGRGWVVGHVSGIDWDDGEPIDLCVPCGCQKETTR